MTPVFSRRMAIVLMAYVGIVLAVDTLAAQQVDWPFEWKIFQWMPFSYGALAGADLFKLFSWLAIPVLICWRGLNREWLKPSGIQKQDVIFLLVILIGGLLAMSVIPHIPHLSSSYPRLQLLPAADRLEILQVQLVWTASWIIGWEFLHRYCLLNASTQLFPVRGWWLVPLSEGLYHLQKPPLEAIGMVLLSVFLTRWTLRRGNLWPALLAHLIIELELMAYQLL